MRGIPPDGCRKRMQDDGWDFVCRLKKNRRFNGQAVRTYRRHSYWAETEWLMGSLKIWVVRDGAKYDATNRLILAAAEAHRLFQFRAQIEEVIRVLTDQLGLAGCKARSEWAQLHHLTCCLVAFCALGGESYDRRVSIYSLKRCLSFQGCSVALPALERLRSAA
jgi:hypothetical protein